jgi:hypothetical protein
MDDLRVSNKTFLSGRPSAVPSAPLLHTEGPLRVIRVGSRCPSGCRFALDNCRDVAVPRTTGCAIGRSYTAPCPDDSSRPKPAAWRLTSRFRNRTFSAIWRRIFAANSGRVTWGLSVRRPTSSHCSARPNGGETMRDALLFGLGGRNHRTRQDRARRVIFARRAGYSAG